MITFVDHARGETVARVDESRDIGPLFSYRSLFVASEIRLVSPTPAGMSNMHISCKAISL